jgi:hypothetical protein
MKEVFSRSRAMSWQRGIEGEMKCGSRALMAGSMELKVD